MLYYSMNVIWPRQSALLWIPANNTIIRGVYSNLVSFGTILAGWYMLGVMPWIKHERWQIIGFVIAQTALIGSLASVGINDRIQAIVTVVIVSMTNLPPSPISFSMVSLHLQDQTDIGVAVGLISTFRLMGGAVATAIYTAIQTTRYAHLLPDQVVAAAQSSGFNGSVSALITAAKVNTVAAYGKIPGITNTTIAATELAVKEAAANSYHLVYFVAIAFGTLAIAASFTIKGVEDSSRTGHTAVHLENDVHDGGKIID